LYEQLVVLALDKIVSLFEGGQKEVLAVAVVDDEDSGVESDPELTWEDKRVMESGEMEGEDGIRTSADDSEWFRATNKSYIP
jgi:hypothetical protein